MGAFLPRSGLAEFIRQRRLWEKRTAAFRAGPGTQPSGGGPSALREDHAFGSNPGRLRMLSYVPAGAPRPGLVVVLHGCTQPAAAYAQGTGWLALAERQGFALLAPEQRRENNAGACFNWFLRTDTRRGHGEALSIRQMVEELSARQDLDRSRIFVTGLSAGGAMANVMLATYPELFAGGAIIAGLPYGSARNVQDAFAAMNNPRTDPAERLGERVRAASDHAGSWPRISVWQGERDQTVAPANAAEIVKQWASVHGIDPAAPAATEDGTHARHRAWRDGGGRIAVEEWTIPALGHGVPLAAGKASGEEPGPFLLDAGISSTAHIAAFFGLAPEPKRPQGGTPRPSPDPIRSTIERALRAAGLG